jgi:hypothetical protein
MTAGEEDLVSILHPQLPDRTADMTGADGSDWDLRLRCLRLITGRPRRCAENQRPGSCDDGTATAIDRLMLAHWNLMQPWPSRAGQAIETANRY